VNFRSTTDLNRAVMALSTTLPRDIDLVVAVPRSGLLAGTLLSLHLNLSLTDLEGFLTGRIITSGARLGPVGDRKLRKVVVVDDSVNSGRTLAEIRARIDAADLPCEVLYLAIYVTEATKDLVDHYHEVLPTPRVFAWNVLHHDSLARCCVDIDGILCEDPTPEQNDDGPEYARFLTDTRPLYHVTRPMGWLVTSRLEKYRSRTEKWLDRHGLRYGELIMLDLPDKAARAAIPDVHERHKAHAYRATDALLFIESDEFQAAGIAEHSGRPALCLPEQRIYYPESFGANAGEVLRRAGKSLRTRARGLSLRLFDRFLDRKPN